MYNNCLNEMRRLPQQITNTVIVVSRCCALTLRESTILIITNSRTVTTPVSTDDISTERQDSHKIITKQELALVG